MEAIGDIALKAARDAFLKARKGTADRRKAKRQKATPEATVQSPSFSSDMKATAAPSTESTVPGKPKRRDHVPGYGAPPPEALLGRPVIWTPESMALWKAAILEHIGAGKSLMGFVRDYPNAPTRFTVFQWLEQDASFASMYRRARENGADAMADDLLNIADDVKDSVNAAQVNAARLRVDARKWSASKLKPGVYADRLETVQSGQVTVTHTLSDADRALALASLMARRAIAGSSDMQDAMRRLADGPTLELTADGPALPDGEKTP